MTTTPAMTLMATRAKALTMTVTPPQTQALPPGYTHSWSVELRHHPLVYTNRSTLCSEGKPVTLGVVDQLCGASCGIDTPGRERAAQESPCLNMPAVGLVQPTSAHFGAVLATASLRASHRQPC